MKRSTNSSLNEKVPPATRLAKEHQAEKGLESARSLVRAKKYKEAFRQYKETLANAEGVDVFPSHKELTQLATHYRPALVALKQWRNQKEKLLLEQNADSTTFAQWRILNRCLNDKDRMMSLFQQLRARGADPQDGALRHIYWKIWPLLARRKQYEELRPFLSTLGWITFLHVAEYDTHVYFPTKGSGYQSVEQIIEEGALVFEVALALEEGAETVAEKLLSVDDGDATYAALIKSARRAGGNEQAKALYAQAREKLGNRRVRKSTKAMGPLAKK